MSTETKFIELRKKALEKIFGRMNDMQRQAVFKINGPVLILAGAGSGKTTVLVNRIANILRFGNAYYSSYVPPHLSDFDIRCLEDYINSSGGIQPSDDLLCDRYCPQPYNILAITFTNKAAAELKQRLADMLGERANDIQASTFHSACVRILRRNIDRLGYASSFAIYDTDDSLRIIKDALKLENLSDKNFNPRAILGYISRAKDKLITAEQAVQNAGLDFKEKIFSKIYMHYQTMLKNANAVDFDDIIILTVRLFQQCPDVLSYYQEKYKYIMVDEYQDTNNAQYMLVSLLAQKHKNLCVVGDDDQSIYKFRGATIENILSFEKQFENAAVIRLEQNYRCTQTILDAANSVIANNIQRKGKTLWTNNGSGEKIKIYRAADEQGESMYIASEILENVRSGMKYSDHAVLYRMNAQSNEIEKSMIKSGIPYRIFGGKRFFERKEIKDVVAILSVINNPNDTLRLKRIINEPKRGIGDTTIAKAEGIANTLGISLFEVLAGSGEYAPLANRAKQLKDFAQTYQALMDMADNTTLDSLFDAAMSMTGYLGQYSMSSSEDITRIENINEFKSNIIKYQEENEEPTLSGFLEEISLYTDLDTYNDDEDKVVMMTLHSAKGLEFPVVFIAGVEEGLFPSMLSINNPEEIEEERRLAYVGCTRAKKMLHLTNAAERIIFGQTNRYRPSRFISEIPKELCDYTDKTIRLSKAPAGVSAERPQYSAASSTVGIGGAPKPQAVLGYGVGDTVRHKTFGNGMVIKITPMGNDNLIEIAFENVGTKKIMANFAKLTKI
ncbi:MAG TPA: ATP-dependent DNA helicase PcrA [Ruminococcaceae bacterium]|nr:ATP-dependent DNA helicase PcrA [Oscillospiraceae bacterium]